MVIIRYYLVPHCFIFNIILTIMSVERQQRYTDRLVWCEYLRTTFQMSIILRCLIDERVRYIISPLNVYALCRSSNTTSIIISNSRARSPLGARGNNSKYRNIELEIERRRFPSNRSITAIVVTLTWTHGYVFVFWSVLDWIFVFIIFSFFFLHFLYFYIV